MANETRFKAPSAVKFIVQVLVTAVLGVGFIVSLGIILADGYRVSDVPVIALSSINAIAVVALAFFTYYYMKASEAMATHMKDSQEMAFELNYRPRVSLSFKAKSSTAIYLIIANQGNGAARNIQVSFDPPLATTTGKTPQTHPAFRDGISYLAPGETFSFFFDTAISLFSREDVPRSYTAHVEYDWAVENRPRISEQDTLDLSHLEGTDLGSYKDESTLIDEVEKIRKALEKLDKKA